MHIAHNRWPVPSHYELSSLIHTGYCAAKGGPALRDRFIDERIGAA